LTAGTTGGFHLQHKMRLVCRDGVAVALPPPVVRQCRVLAHMLADCADPNVDTCVPLCSGAVQRLCTQDADYAAWGTHELVDVALAADFLAHEDALQALPASCASGWRQTMPSWTSWDLPCHILCLVAHNLQLEALCQLVLRRAELGDVLKPRMLTLATDVTLSSAAAAGWLNTCRWLTETFHLTATTHARSATTCTTVCC
jgi:hypothetical protein